MNASDGGTESALPGCLRKDCEDLYVGGPRGGAALEIMVRHHCSDSMDWLITHSVPMGWWVPVFENTCVGES